MNRVFVLLLISTAYSAAYGQILISGKVRDLKGKPVVAASISIQDAYDGCTSDTLGNFSFVTTEQGEHILQVTAIGYVKQDQKISLTGTEVHIIFTIKEEPSELKAVIITAGSFEASDSKRTTVLRSIDIVTTASANADIISAVRTLPGTQQVGEKEGLFVRGGTASESKIFIDGTLVNNFFLSGAPDIASRGRFSPFLFKGTIFSSGGYSAQYGQALSSVLILETIDMPERSSASLSMTTVGVSAGYQQLSKSKKSSWGSTYNYTNLFPYFLAVKQQPDYFRVPAFHNSDFNYRLKTSRVGILKFYGYFNSGVLGLRRPDIDSSTLKDAFELKNLNLYANLSWKEMIGNKWKINLGLSWSANTDRILSELQNADNLKQAIITIPFNQKNFRLNHRSTLSVAKAVFERKIKGLTAIRFGGEYFLMHDGSLYSNDTLYNQSSSVHDRLKSAFAEADIFLTNDLAAKIGGRIEHASLLKKPNFAPRISLAYKLSNAGQLSMAYGIFYQNPENSFYSARYKYNEMDYTKSLHYILNYQKVSQFYTLRVEAFYKKYDHLIKTTPVLYNQDSLSNDGYGYADGIELFWRDRKTFKNVDYWISYAYLDTKRDYLNYPGIMRPGFAAVHTASLVVKKFVTALKTQFNGSYAFATGRPYYDLRYIESAKRYSVAASGKTINYNSLSLSVNYLPNINKPAGKRFAVFVFSVTNVLGSKQVFGYHFSYDGLRREPVSPTAGRFYFLGCFLSFGVDRSDDMINSNL